MPIFVVLVEMAGIIAHEVLGFAVVSLGILLLFVAYEFVSGFVAGFFGETGQRAKRKADRWL